MVKHYTKTKIVATIGPSSSTVAVLEKMIKAGMRVARLNFSHGEYSGHAALVKNIRLAAKNVGAEVAILQDLQGPRIRVGALPKDGVPVKRGQTVVLVGENIHKQGIKNFITIPIQYNNLYRDVKKGAVILIEDGTIQLVVSQVKDAAIYCKVKIAGTIKTHKGINVPGFTLSVDVITAKDKQDVEFGQTLGVDYVALSFVKNRNDIVRLKKLIEKAQLKSEKVRSHVIAKVERQEALDNFEEIIEEVDGIMVARGDLALEVAAETVPLQQKAMIEWCLHKAKPVIVATQMLDSMINNPQPTRAEISDVANAVIDHSDAIMLSGESATGKYPVQAITMMTKIASATEASHYDNFACGPFEITHRASAIAVAACGMSDQAKAAIVYSENGDAARLLSRHRPSLPIIALTPHVKVLRQLALSWGVIAVLVSPKATAKTLLTGAIKILKDEKIAMDGDSIVVLGGEPFGKNQQLSSLRMIHIGEKI